MVTQPQPADGHSSPRRQDRGRPTSIGRWPLTACPIAPKPGGGAHFSAAEPSPRAGPGFNPGGPWSPNPQPVDEQFPNVPSRLMTIRRRGGRTVVGQPRLVDGHQPHAPPRRNAEAERTLVLRSPTHVQARVLTRVDHDRPTPDRPMNIAAQPQPVDEHGHPTPNDRWLWSANPNTNEICLGG